MGGEVEEVGSDEGVHVLVDAEGEFDFLPRDNLLATPRLPLLPLLLELPKPPSEDPPVFSIAAKAGSAEDDREFGLLSEE